jgi:hypothetical protein
VHHRTRALRKSPGSSGKTNGEVIETQLELENAGEISDCT